jgi:hypothetical protein
MMPAQQVEKARGPVGIGAAVEGERDSAGGHGRGRDVVPVDSAQDRTALADGLGRGCGAGDT